MTEWQREREKMEFERASALYKPISEVMSSRFVSAQSHDISHVGEYLELELLERIFSSTSYSCFTIMSHYVGVFNYVDLSA